MAVNAAAAELCMRDPTLLVQREELFVRARCLVRDSGYKYVHGHSRSKLLQVRLTTSSSTVGLHSEDMSSIDQLGY